MKRIAILGSAPSSVNLAPFADPSWTIWATSPGNRGRLPRIDAWFEIHDIDAADRTTPGYLDWLAEQDCTVVLQKEDARFRHVEVYPREQVEEVYGPHFLTSSIAWMLAKAILDGAEEIGIWGVDMAHQTEWAYQKPGCQFFIREARQAGVRVTVPPQSDLDKAAPLYGFGRQSDMALKCRARRDELQARSNQIEAERNRLEQKARSIRDEELVLSGAIQDMDYVLNTWAD